MIRVGIYYGFNAGPLGYHNPKCVVPLTYRKIRLTASSLEPEELDDSDTCIWSLSHDDKCLVNLVRKHIDELSLSLPYLQVPSGVLWSLPFPHMVSGIFGFNHGTPQRKRMIALTPSLLLHVGPYAFRNNITFNSHSMRKSDMLDKGAPPSESYPSSVLPRTAGASAAEEQVRPQKTPRTTRAQKQDTGNPGANIVEMKTKICPDHGVIPEYHLKIFENGRHYCKLATNPVCADKFALPTYLVGNTRGSMVFSRTTNAEGIDGLKICGRASLRLNFTQRKKFAKTPTPSSFARRVKQRQGESTSAYVERYKDECIHVKACPEILKISGLHAMEKTINKPSNLSNSSANRQIGQGRQIGSPRYKNIKKGKINKGCRGKKDAPRDRLTPSIWCQSCSQRKTKQKSHSKNFRKGSEYQSFLPTLTALVQRMVEPLTIEINA
ncbi:hypothetical protein Tco_0098024 [Tanacetum coccineum]